MSSQSISSSSIHQVIDLMTALTSCVRAFTPDQITVGYFAGNERVTDRCIAKLLCSGMLARRSVLVRTIEIPTQPLFVWSPKSKPPYCQRLVATARKRLDDLPTKQLTVYTRGVAADKLFGSRRGKILAHPLQVSHDLGLAGTYLAMRRDRPELADRWRGEDSSIRLPGQVPDAICFDEQGEPEIAIEFCGLYSAKRFQRFHQFCAERGLPYELW